MEDKPKSFREIILADWIPALITAGLGGLIVALIVPSVQSSYARQAEFEKQKITLWQSMAEDFKNYINYRARLNSVALEEREIFKRGAPLPEQFKKRKEEYRIQRDSYAIKLRKDFLFAEYYFGDNVRKTIREFLDWHRPYETATVENLPPTEEYTKWRDKIVALAGKTLE